MANTKDNPQKKKRQRKKRQSEVLPLHILNEAENQFSEVVQTAIKARQSVFDNDNQYSIDDLAEYFTNTSNDLKNRILPLEKRRYLSTQVY